MIMDSMKSILTIGETNTVEFKRCGNGIESDTYETVCSFLNRYGLIADFFRNIGLADELVAGVRNLYMKL